MILARKELIIPILPHLAKFVKKEYDSHSNMVVINRNIIPPKFICVSNYQRYFKDVSDKYTYIKVYTNDSKLYKLYAWLQHVNVHFTNKMVDYIAVRYDQQYATNSIREFLAIYDIIPSDYDFHTFYKKWQRSKQYKILKTHHKALKSCQT